MSHQFVGDHSRLDELVPLLQRVNELASFETDGLTVYLDAVDYSTCHEVRDDFKFQHFFGVQGIHSTVRPLPY